MKNHQVMIDAVMLWMGRIILPAAAVMLAVLAVVVVISAATTGIQIIGTAGTVEVPPVQVIAMAITWGITSLMLLYASGKVWKRKPLVY